MSLIKHKYPNIANFIDGVNGFDEFYTKNLDFNDLFVKLDIVENFMHNIMENLDVFKAEELNKKLKTDPNLFMKAIDYINKDEQCLPEKNKTLYIDSESSDEILNLENDKESVSSLDDMNSKDSDMDDNDLDEDNIRENRELKIMFSKSLIELNIRRNHRDIFAEKIKE